MDQDLSTHRCQAKSKSDRGTDSSVTSTDPSSISNENSYGSLETPSSPTKPSSPEENAQEIYPWMKEFRSKGTKQNSYFRTFCACVPKTYAGHKVGVGRLKPLGFLWSSCAYFSSNISTLEKTNL